jgi:hypothetical protein
VSTCGNYTIVGGKDGRISSFNLQVPGHHPTTPPFFFFLFSPNSGETRFANVSFVSQIHFF